MKLENIGFYTLEDKRAKEVSLMTNLYRCELLITSKCNFNCLYCRGTDKSADISFTQALRILAYWAKENLINIRFSGGEPTMVTWLPDIVQAAVSLGMQRVAVSTNGSASRELYNELIDKGVNDFSISLDACCASTGDMMSGSSNMWEKVTSNIKHIAARTYVTVGVVLTETNINELPEIIKFASYELGVNDIRIITAAQWDKTLKGIDIPQDILDRHPILNYRITNFRKGKQVRGITERDNPMCPLVLDDAAVKGDHHYPCIIKMREGCDPIGKIGPNMRQERYEYYLKTNCYKDPICKKNCLDVCIDYNNKVKELNHESNYKRNKNTLGYYKTEG